MALNKITDAQMTAYGVTSAPDKLTGTAAENKALFDRLIRQVVAARYNALVDALQAVTGAGEIGAGVDGIDGSTVQAILTALKALRDSDSSAQGATNTSLQAEIDNRYTKDQTDTLLSAKFDTVKANELVKTIQFNGDTGVFTITTQGGTATTIDTLLEKVPAAFSLEGNKLVLTLEDGTKQEADLSAFIDTYTFNDSGTIGFSQTEKNISAQVKDGSITLAKLDNTAQQTLAGYAERAEAAEEGAEAAKTAAEAAKTTAQSAAATATAKAGEASASQQAAKSSETAAKASETNAKTSEENAAGSEKAAESYAKGGTGTRTGEDTDNARYYSGKAKEYMEQAGEIVGGDFATKSELETAVAAVQTNLDSHTGNSTIHVTADEKAAWNGKDVFIATYGETTNAEIEAAYQAGKAIFLQLDNTYPRVPLSIRLSSGNMFGFIQATSNVAMTLYQCAGDAWSTSISNTHASTHATGGTDPITPASIGAAAQSTTVTATLSAASWTGDAAPYSYSLSVTGVTETSNQEILPAIDITAEQLEALQAANIQDGGQAAGSITLKAFGDVPTIDIPIRVIVRGDA